MKIGIDARMLASNFGIGRYLQELIAALAATTPAERLNLDFVIFVKTQEQAQLVESLHLGKVVRANIHWYTIKEQLKFSKIIDKEKIDLMHFPHWNVPLNYHGRFVLTIHDLIMYHFPRPEATTLGPIKFWVKNKFHRLVVQSAAERAEKIITPTQFTRQDVAETLKIPAEKIIVTHLAPAQKTTISTISNQEEENILTAYKIQKPYLLYVGSAYPHKNLAGLISAWNIFNKQYSHNYELVLAGPPDVFYKKLLKKNPAENLIFVPNPSDQNLNALYKHARAFVFPSLYEGFGLPPLEAMANKIPTIASKASCLPEILKNAAEYFNPQNPDEIAQTIQKIFTDENLRAQLIATGTDLLPQYSWQKTANQTLSLYQSFSYTI